jgi:hypothetical protein
VECQGERTEFLTDTELIIVIESIATLTDIEAARELTARNVPVPGRFRRAWTDDDVRRIRSRIKIDADR